VLLILTLIIGFSLIVTGSENHVLRKSIKVAQLPLTHLTAVGLAHVVPRLRTPVWRAAAATLTIFGAVTLVTDIRQHVRPFHDPAAATESTYVTPAEMRALRWIRQNTSPLAVVQAMGEVRPERRRGDTYNSLIASFGERRTLFGNYVNPWLFRVPSAAIHERLGTLVAVSMAPNAEALVQRLNGLRVDYLWIDSREPAPWSALRELVVDGRARLVFEDAPITVIGLGRTFRQEVR
jgi:hypothetical protein